MTRRLVTAGVAWLLLSAAWICITYRALTHEEQS